jgi:hypothetical protein
MGGGFRWCDFRIIGHRLSRPHCRCGYGVPTLKGMVGGGWGRRPWELVAAPEGEGIFSYMVGKNIRQDKTRQGKVRQCYNRGTDKH